MRELLRFRRCRDLHGNEITLTFGWRNGKPAVFFRPQIEDSAPAPEAEEPSIRSGLTSDNPINDDHV